MTYRTDLLKTFQSALCAVLVLVGSVGFADETPPPPNIVFLMTDDQRWDNFGCYGRPEFETHHIDRLAEQGVIFDNAYYAVSICMPSRVTMMTGVTFPITVSVSPRRTTTRCHAPISLTVIRRN